MKPTPILHMDLKAQNFLLDQQGRVCHLSISRTTLSPMYFPVIIESLNWAIWSWVGKPFKQKKNFSASRSITKNFPISIEFFSFSLSTFLCVPDFAQCVRSRRSCSQDLTMGTITEVVHTWFDYYIITSSNISSYMYLTLCLACQTNSDADALLSQSHSEYEQPDQQVR